MRRRAGIKRALRTAAVVFAGALVLVLALVSRARAEAEEQLWRLGESLSSLGERVDPTGDPRTLVVNGAEVVIRSERVDADVPTVLDRAERACDGFEVGERSTTLRAGNADHGFVACFSGLAGLGTSELIEAGASFLADGDLSRLGAFDYTYVRARDSGVHQLRARIPRLNVDIMFPESGDAPGLDVAGVPRPPAARRILSAFNVDQPYQVAIYRGDGDRAGHRQIVEGYRRQMTDAGWRVRAGRTNDARATLVAFRGSEMVVIVVRATDGAIVTTIAAGL